MSVSIITVCFNCKRTIRQTIESVLRWRDQLAEYVVVDGGSTDGTVDILAEFEHKFAGRLKWISEPDKGIYDAMNKGLRMATGEWVNYQNDGDMLTNIPVAELEKASVERIGLLACSVETENGIGSSCLGFVTKCRNTIQHQAAFYNRELLERLGGFDDTFKILGDHDLNVRLLRSGSKVKISDTVCAFHSLHGVSSVGGAKLKAEMRRVVRKNYGFAMMCVAWVENKMFGAWQWLSACRGRVIGR